MTRRRWMLPFVAFGAALIYRGWRRGSLHQFVENTKTFSSMKNFSSRSARLYDAAIAAPAEFIYRRIAQDAVAQLSTGAILDVGAGPGRLAARIAQLAPGVTVTGLDLSPEMVDLARRRAASAGVVGRVRFEVGDVAAMPFRDGQFDLVVSSFSMHHWEDVPGGLAEIHRVLKPGGEARIYDITGNVLKLFRHGDPISAEEVARLFGGDAQDRAWNPGRVPLLRRLSLT